MEPLFTWSGRIVMGNQLGRTIGFPTANLIPGDDFPPGIRHGVYAVRASVTGLLYDGMANIGIRPTIGDKILTVEVNLFDFSADIYGEFIVIWFYDFLRPEKKFSGLEELKSQIRKDQVRVKMLLAMRPKPDPDSQ